ncbi:MAG: hypothetical protein JNL22_08920 [Bacteroidales bacterium]|jgi:hypothetical protein|nr:hypothetical protein [Bacteroidales bacterium]
MKTERLEQFVKDNAEGFDTLNPPDLAWEVIEKQLPSQRKPVVKRLWPYAWKAAAAVLIFAAAWMLNDLRDFSRSSDGSSLAKKEINPALDNLSDAEAYYTSQISSRQAELAAYARQHPEILEDLKTEFSEMDRKKADLKADLTESNADEKVIEAIILSYRVKIEILDEMLTALKKAEGESMEDDQSAEDVEL